MWKDLLYYFGYATHPTEENSTGYFEMEPNETDLENFMAFKKFNQEQLDFILNNKEEAEKIRYVCIADEEFKPKFGSDKAVLHKYAMDF